MSAIDKSLEIVEASFNLPFNTIKRYNIYINGKRTSVTLEPKSWEVIKSIAAYEKISVDDLCELISSRRGTSSNMSSAIRVFLISYLDVYFKRGTEKTTRK
jgi:predicted DNA-binding ribbon-helix-helix protein